VFLKKEQESDAESYSSFSIWRPSDLFCRLNAIT
jgi:hypothetical protein